MESIEESSELAALKTAVVEEWLSKFKSQTLSNTDLWDHWCKWVPKAYHPKEGTNYEPQVDQSILDTILIQSLEDFITGNDKVTVKSISEKNSNVCGKIFISGEILFHCFSCSIDPTCVLCLNCFKKSAHRNHNYKIGTSGGSGCCDCGDELSWKKDPYCEDHPGSDKESSEEKLAQDVLDRARLWISSLLQYCFEMTTQTRTPDHCPRVLTSIRSELKSRKGTFCTVLYDDQIHSVQQVADLLEVQKSYSSEEVFTLTRYASEVGRVILGYSPYEVSLSFCQEALKQLPLLSIHTSSWTYVSHQEFSLHLLVWLEKFIRSSKELRDIFTMEALNSDKNSLSSCCVNGAVLSIVEGILISDYKLWKTAEVNWHNLILSGMLLDLENKIAFSEKYLQHYKTISENNSKAQSNQSFISSLSVQVFTIPNIAQHVIARENALLIMLKTFYSEYPKFCLSSMSQDSVYSHFYDLCNILTEIGYLLGSPPDNWTQELRKAFLAAISFSLEVLTFMQSVYQNFREVNSEFSGHSVPELKLQSEFLSILNSMLDWCSKDKIVLIKIFKMTLKALASRFKKPVHLRHFAGHDGECYFYKRSNRPVTLFLPLSRFFGSLYLHLLSNSLDYSTPDFNGLRKPSPRDILDPLVEIQLLIAEDRIGILRNGFSIKNLINYYKNAKSRERTFDKDIILIQICATLIENNSFLIHLLNQYDLLNWAEENFDPGDYNEESLKAIVSKSEELFFLLITLIGERHLPQIGKVTPVERIKHEMLHKLFLKPQTHSELISSFERICQKNPEIDLDKIINEIATFHKPQDDSHSGLYRVKKDLIHLYNVFFYHYTEDERAKSEEEQRKLRKQYEGLDCCPPPPLSQLNQPFLPLANLLSSDVLMCLMKTVLDRSCGPKSETVSDQSLRSVLHLIGYALQERQNNVFSNFVSSDEKWGIKTVLEKLVSSKSVKSHKELMQWVLNKYRDVLNELNPSTSGTGGEGGSTESTMPDQEEDVEQQAFQKKAAERKAAIMAQMSSLQAQFVKKHYSLLQDSEDVAMDCQSSYSNEDSDFMKKTCILCREDGAVTMNGPAMILAAFLQKSVVFPLNDVNRSSLEVLNESRVHPNSCGHAMHHSCWQKYLQVEYKKINQRGRSKFSFDPAFQEYLCPLCKSLCNTVIPLIPLNSIEDVTSFDDWIKVMRNPSGNKVTQEICKNCEITTKTHSGGATYDQNEIYCDCFNCEESFSSPLFRTNDNKETSKIVTRWKEFADGAFSSDLTTSLHSYVSALDSVSDSASENPPDLFSFRNGFKVWTSLTCKIRSLELYLRFSNKPLLGSLSSSQESCTSSLVSLSAFYAMYKDPFGHYAIKNYFKEIISSIFNPQENENKRFLNCECFHVFLCLTMASHSFENKSFSQGIHFDRNLFRLVLFVNFAQILGSLEIDKINSMESEPGSEATCLDGILKLYNQSTEISEKVWEYLKKESMVFLRCCALLYQFVSGVDPPEALQFLEGDTFEGILGYLGCPFVCKELLGTPEVFELFRKWSNLNYLKEVSVRTEQSPKMLIKLPDDYFQLIETAERYQCPTCEKKGIKNQSLCLLCGTIMCSEMICSRKEISGKVVGPCTYHSESCGRGSGLFLTLKSSCIVLLSSRPKRGCLIPGPYIDTYGEVDEGLFRGGPLSLCKDKFSHLQLAWVSHSLPEMIFRRIDRLNEAYLGDPWNVLLFL